MKPRRKICATPKGKIHENLKGVGERERENARVRYHELGDVVYIYSEKATLAVGR